MESVIYLLLCDEFVEVFVIIIVLIGIVVKSDDKCYLLDLVFIKEVENVLLWKLIDQL